MTDDSRKASEELLTQLLAVQRHKWCAGERVSVEELLAQDSSLLSDPDAVLDCIYGEFRLRVELGESPALEEYVSRFPNLEPEIRDLADVHRELGGGKALAPLDIGTVVNEPSLPQHLDRYELLEEVGRGGMAIVYRASHRDLGSTVALKVFHGLQVSGSDAARRMHREIDALAAIDHAGVVSIRDACCTGNTPYLVMDYVEGKDLRTLLSEEGPLSPEAACDCIRQAAVALEAIHQAGVVHRDIKPSNLIIEEHDASDRRTVKILDLGLARVVDVLDDEHLTRDGVILGTIDYIAPEQLNAPHEAGPAADVFALGCTLFEALSGRLPFGDGGFVARLVARTTIDAPSVADVCPQIPRSLAAVVDRMIRRDPVERYASAGAVAAALSPFSEAGQIYSQCITERSAQSAVRVADLRASELSGIGDDPNSLIDLLKWAEAAGEMEVACRVAVPLASYWHCRGHVVEAGKVLDRLLDCNLDKVPPLLRAGVLVAVAALAVARGETEAALKAYESALSIARRCRSPAATAAVLADLGILYRARGNQDLAQTVCRGSMVLQREFAIERHLASVLNTLGNLYFDRAELDRSRSCFEEARALSARLGRREWEAHHIVNLGRVAQEQGRISEAVSLVGEGLKIYREIGSAAGEAFAQTNLGSLACERGEIDDARRQFEYAHKLFSDLGDRRGLAITLNNLGHVSHAAGELIQARTYYDESAALLDPEQPVWGTISLNRARWAQNTGRSDEARRFVASALQSLMSPIRPLRLVATLEFVAELWMERDPAKTCELLGTAVAVRERAGAAVLPSRREGLDRIHESCKKQLGAEKYRELLDSGRACELHEVVARVTGVAP